MSPRTRLLLFVSLGLNLFLVGLIVGGLTLGARDRATRGHAKSRSLISVAERLEPANRESFHALLRREAEEARPRVRALRQARGEAATAVTADPYDPQAAAAALDRARAEELALRRELDREVLVYAVRLSPDERALLAEALRRRGGWRPMRSGHEPGRADSAAKDERSR